jgi:hypothetical protein
MKNHFISRSELLSIHSDTLQDISIYNLSMWLKSKTGGKFIIIERGFVIAAIKYIEKNRFTDEFLGHDIKKQWDLEIIRSYI